MTTNPIEITLDPQKNPEFFEVMTGYNELMVEFNKINEKLHNFPVYSFYTPIRMMRLRKLGGEVLKLSTKWLKSQSEARRFYREPHYRISHDPQHLVFKHYQSILLDQIGHFRGLMLVLESNYDKNYNVLKSQLNFNIAIASFVLSIVGLSLSLILA